MHPGLQPSNSRTLTPPLQSPFPTLSQASLAKPKTVPAERPKRSCGPCLPRARTRSSRKGARSFDQPLQSSSAGLSRTVVGLLGLMLSGRLKDRDETPRLQVLPATVRLAVTDGTKEDGIPVRIPIQYVFREKQTFTPSEAGAHSARARSHLRNHAEEAAPGCALPGGELAADMTHQHHLHLLIRIRLRRLLRGLWHCELCVCHDRR